MSSRLHNITRPNEISFKKVRSLSCLSVPLSVSLPFLSQHLLEAHYVAL